MIKIAEILSSGIPHLRVDFYNFPDRVYIGELTFCHGCGHHPFRPDAYSEIFGEWIELPGTKSL
jgi:hypothetical protein